MLSITQATVTTQAAALCVIPPGPCTVTITNASGTAADIVYIGTGSGVSSGTGAPVPAGQSVPIIGYQGSAGGELWAVGIADTAVGVIISAPG